MRPALLALASVLLVVTPFAGCLGPRAEAHATLHFTTPFGDGHGDETYGTANLTQSGNRLTVRVEVWGLPPGPKGTHIHEGRACSPGFAEGRTMLGGAALGHFNPGNASHPDHAGDLGNLEVGEDGRGVLETTVRRVNLDTNDTWSALGRAIVIHERADDLASQPAGDAGGRLLCGIIRQVYA